MLTPIRTTLFAILSLLALFAGGAAHAHAVVLSVSPEDGSLLETAPESLHIRYNEGVRPLAIHLVAPGGIETDLTERVPGAQELVIPLDDLGRGTHVLSWRVASADGHPVAGSVIFSVGEVTGAAAIADHDPVLWAAIWLARFAMTAALVLGVGGAFCGTWSRPVAEAGRPVAALLIASLIVVPTYAGLNGLDALGLGFGAIASSAPWAASWETSVGPAALMAMGAALCALIGLRIRAFAWLGVALLALSYAISGHAGTAEPRILSRPAVTVHLIAVIFWVGSLLPLALALRKGVEGLHRFSVVIPYVLVVLVVAGFTLARLQMGPHPDQWRSTYGYILLAKLAVVAVLLALGALNRWKWTRPALAGDGRAQRAMRRSIGVELGLALVVLGLTAGWRLTPPPRALAEAHAAIPPAYGHAHSDKLMANLTMTPGTVGPVSFEIDFMDGEGEPVQPYAATVTLSRPDLGIAELTKEAVPSDEVKGKWLVPDLFMPFAGTWTVGLEVRPTRFDLVVIQGDITVGEGG